MNLYVFLILNCFQELPKRISTAEEKEILSLLCRVHELEIDKVDKACYAMEDDI